MLQVGEEFDRYRIEAELGAGGMGRVYRAFDQRLQRRVALKVLLLDSVLGTASHADASARLVREARAAAAFEHPNKVSVFDVGTYEGSPYIAMELVVGRPLRSFIGQVGVPLATRLGWLLEIARVLGAAHATGLVHRDIKPENVMVRDDGDVKVLDFGIARRVERPPDGDAATLAASISTLTGAGVSLGTPLYMAPEQIRAEKLDGRVDQFAWGTLALELLSGRHPWATGRDLAGAIAAIVSSEPPALPPELGIPQAAEAAIRRSLAKDPEQRFRSFDELVAALQSGAGVVAQGSTLVMERRPSDAPSSAETPLRVTTKGGVAASTTPEAPSPRRPAWLFGVLAAVLVVAVGAWLALKKPAGPALEEPRAGLANLERFRNARGSDALAFESANLWQATAQDFARASKDPRAPARWRAGRALAEGKAALAGDQEQQALSKLREAIALDPDWALPHSSLCSALARVGQLDEALREAARAEQLDPSWWGGPAASAGANAYAGKLEQAIEDYRRALSLSPERPLLLAQLALVYHASRLDSEAERLAKRALELDPDLVPPRLLLAERAIEQQDGETALREATHALSVQPQSLPTRLAQAEAFKLLKRDAEALDAYRRALALWESKGRGGPFAARMAGVQAALASGTLPGVGVAPAPSASPVERSPVPAAKAPPGAPRSAVSAPKPRSPHDGRNNFEQF